MNILIASSISKHAIQILEQKHDVICAFNESPEKLAFLMKDINLIIFRSGVEISREVLTINYMKLHLNYHMVIVPRQSGNP